jgi:Putative transposase of IS4/5 family (DUF4096)
MRRYGIRDDQWERIRDLLPGQEGHVGVTAADNRLFVEAVLYRYRTGMPWRDLPEMDFVMLKDRCQLSTFVARHGASHHHLIALDFDAHRKYGTGNQQSRPEGHNQQGLCPHGSTAFIPPFKGRPLPA